MPIKGKILNKALLKRWWFWVIVIVVAGIAIATSSGSSKSDDTANKATDKSQSITYTITGETLGEYGKEVTLNKDSDLPVKKYLYKLPAGEYIVTTTFEDEAKFYIVKDEIKLTPFDKEELDYTGRGYRLTADKENEFGRRKSEVEISLSENESIEIDGSNSFIFKTR